MYWTNIINGYLSRWTLTSTRGDNAMIEFDFSIGSVVRAKIQPIWVQTTISSKSDDDTRPHWTLSTQSSHCFRWNDNSKMN